VLFSSVQNFYLFVIAWHSGTTVLQKCLLHDSETWRGSFIAYFTTLKKIKKRKLHSWSSGLLCHVWWLGANISEDHGASIFGIEMCGEQKMDIHIGWV